MDSKGQGQTVQIPHILALHEASGAQRRREQEGPAPIQIGDELWLKLHQTMPAVGAGAGGRELVLAEEADAGTDADGLRWYSVERIDMQQPGVAVLPAQQLGNVVDSLAVLRRCSRTMWWVV